MVNQGPRLRNKEPLCRLRQFARPSPTRRGFDRSAIHTSICMELHFAMGWMKFDHSKSDLLAADWTRVMDDVLNPHVTLPPVSG